MREAVFTEREKKRVKRMMKKKLTDEGLKLLSDKELHDIVDKACSGMTDMNLVIAAKNSEAFCSRCGHCCRVCDPIVLREEDVSKLQLFFGQKINSIVKWTKDGWQIRKTKPCFFLKKNECSIYKFRPLICRSYPFSVNDDGEIGVMKYPYCDFLINLAALTAQSLAAMTCLRKKNPQFVSGMSEIADAVYKGVGYDATASQEVRLKKAKDFVEIMSLLSSQQLFDKDKESS